MIAAVVPARNEAKRIGNVLASLRSLVDVIIVVDDGSDDDTHLIVNNFGCVLVRNPENLGVGAATTCGLRHALALGAKVLVCMDADGQHDPQWIPRAEGLISRGGHDVVFGNRFHKLDGIPMTKILSNNFGWDVLRCLLGHHPTCWDVSCGFRIYSQRGAEALEESAQRVPPGYAFVQASCMALHRASLRLTSAPVPAIYGHTVIGTPVGELLQFLRWISEFPLYVTLAREWTAAIASNTPFRFTMTSWADFETMMVIAVKVGDHVILQLDQSSR